MRDARGISMYTELPSANPMRLLTACRVRGTIETTEETATVTGIEIEATEDAHDPHTIDHHDAITITRTLPVETTAPEREKIDMVQDVMIVNGTETGAQGAAMTTDGETVTSLMTEEVVVAVGGIEIAVVEKTAMNSPHKRKAGRTVLLQRNESRHQI